MPYDSSSSVAQYLTKTKKIFSLLIFALALASCNESNQNNNKIPVANAGADQLVIVGVNVALDGSNSIDDDGDSLSYQWGFVSLPEGSLANFSDTSIVSPTFVVDIAGQFEIELTVSDGKSQNSDRILISANTTPVANAGLDQSVETGNTVTLDGSSSSDADGDLLNFQWDIVDFPEGSSAELNDAAAITPSFIADKEGSFVIELKVADSDSESSDSVTVNVSTPNSIPVANAGTDQSHQTGDTVTLDGSSSSDVDGDSLSYQWSLSTPNNSSASLNDSSSVNPEFIADQSGQYQAELTVNDGVIDSPSDGVLINIVTPNTLPVADAGADQTGFTGDLVQLDGSQSTDADGDALSYQWSLIAMPGNSNASVLDSTSVMASFTADIAGQYVVQLIVNDGIDDSTPDAVTINIQIANTIPVANAGPDQNAFVGDTIFLDGNNSMDVDNDPLSFLWSLISQPSDSFSTLDNNQTATPSLDIDKPGQYIAQLIVNDGQANSAADEVIITTENTRPVADAGSEQTINVGEVIQLDGSLSNDVDGDTLSYQWSITSQPTDSVATLSDVMVVNPQLTSDKIGSYVFQLIVSDGVLDSAADTVTVQVLPIASLVLQVTNPPAGLLTNQKSLTLMGNVNETASVSLNGESITVEADLTFSKTVTLTEGENSFNFVASSAAGGTSSVSVTTTLDSVVPESVNIGFVSVSEPGVANAVEITGAAGSAEPGSEVTITNSRTGEVITITVAADGSFSGTMIGIAGDTYTILVVDGAGNKSDKVHTNDRSLPMDPAIVAPALNPIGTTSFIDSISFLYSSGNPIQTGVAADTLDPERVAVIRGEVQDDDNNPLSGVSIKIKNHGEFGQTLTRANGLFDMAVNGGGLLTINFTKDGYLPVQRKVQTPWVTKLRAETIIMIPLDSEATTIDLTDNSQPFQIAQGSTQTDVDGSRQATVFFQQGTTASITLENGSTQTLDTITFRATEYTVGENGPNKMPGALPSTSGYTYAVELSVDEAIAVGASTVTFNQKVPFYVDNFLNFPVGEVVPVGFYDRDKAAWIASENGRVIKIVSITAGVADIDVTGNDVADTGTALADLGITLAEQTQLGTTYSAGKSLWRTQIEHLTPWDCNWPYGPPEDVESPPEDRPESDEEEIPEDECEASGCVIQIESQVLGEDFSITGSDLSLHYRSNRMPGRKTAQTIFIPLSGDSVPASLEGIRLSIEIAGQYIVEEFPAQINLNKRFTWNGVDNFGREISHATAKIQIDYLFTPQFYSAFGEFAASFALAGDSIGLVIGSRGTYAITTSKTWEKDLFSNFRNPISSAGLGGLTINVHHSYDQATETLYSGNGSSIKKEHIGGILAPSDPDTFINSKQNRVDIEGNVYSAKQNRFYPGANRNNWTVISNQILRTSPDGIVTVIAGVGDEFGFSGDGGPAILAKLGEDEIGSLTVTSDGSLFFVDTSNLRIRKIDPNGIITTIGGTDFSNPLKDNGLAINAFMVPSNLVFDKEGNIFFIDDTQDPNVPLNGNRSERIRKITTAGFIYTIAGSGFHGSDIFEGGLATETPLWRPSDLIIDSEGVLYFAEPFGNRVRQITTDGKVTTVAGVGVPGPYGDGRVGTYDPNTNTNPYPIDRGEDNGLQATGANLLRPYGIALDRNGNLFISESGRAIIRRVNSAGIITRIAGNRNGYGDVAPYGLATAQPIPLPYGLSVNQDGDLLIYARDDYYRLALQSRGGLIESKVIARDGQEMYSFDRQGRLIDTRNTLTNQVVYNFTYMSNGYLDTITDVNGEVTSVERFSDGTPIALIAPNGQRTEIILDGSGYAKTLTNPAGETNEMIYLEGGLLDIYTDPNGNIFDYDYDIEGRLINDKSPEGAGWELAITEQNSSSRAVTKISKEGHNTTYHSETLATEDFQRTTTNPDGTQTISLQKRNGETVTTNANGTLNSVVFNPDPRLGMSSPLLGEGNITLPSGLSSSFTNSRTVEQSDPADIFSITQLTNTRTVNGETYSTQTVLADNTVETTSPEGRTHKIVFNPKGKLVEDNVPGFNSLQIAYDTRSRLQRSFSGTGSEQRETIYGYYANGAMKGNLEAETDTEGRVLRYEYDLAGRVSKVTLPDLEQIDYGYDANGNQTTVTFNGQVHQYKYTGMDQIAEYIPPTVAGIANNKTLYSYNKNRQQTALSRPDGKNISWEYNSVSGNLDKITTPLGLINYNYHPVTGQIANVSSPDNDVIAYSFDGHLIKDMSWSGTVSGKVSRNYNSNFDISSVSVNDADEIAFGYDKDGLLNSAGAMLITSELQKDGAINGTSLGVVSTTRSYNDFGEINVYNATVSGVSQFNLTLSYDKLSRILSKVEIIQGVTNRFDYSYDLAGHLETVSKDNVVVESYRYDANGNRSHVNNVVVGVYGAQDRMRSYSGVSYSYTDNGELTEKNASGSISKYDYDVFGNLRHVELPGGATTIDYVVDANDNRIGKKINGVLTQGFLYLDDLNLVAELNDANAIVSRFVYADKSHVPSYMIKAGVTYRIISDLTGSPRLVINITDGSVIQRMDYDAFGNVVSDTNPGFQPFGFAGGLYDVDTKLVRFGARDYDSEVGRLTIKDATRFNSGDTNFYTYVGSDPVNEIDPTGYIKVGIGSQGPARARRNSGRGGFQKTRPGLQPPAYRKVKPSEMSQNSKTNEGMKRAKKESKSLNKEARQEAFERDFPAPEKNSKSLAEILQEEADKKANSGLPFTPKGRYVIVCKPCPSEKDYHDTGMQCEAPGPSMGSPSSAAMSCSCGLTSIFISASGP